MKKSIKKKDKNLEIKISEIESNQDSLLSNFQLCQQGKCDCPTDEYSKLENFNIESSDNQIILNLKPKSDQSFNKEGRERKDKTKEFIILINSFVSFKMLPLL